MAKWGRGGSELEPPEQGRSALWAPHTWDCRISRGGNVITICMSLFLMNSWCCWGAAHLGLSDIERGQRDHYLHVLVLDELLVLLGAAGGSQG